MPTRSIPWPRILAEGAAIVVSILLAFGIQAWWEGRQVEEAFVLQLRSTLAEVEDAQAELTRWVGARSRSVRITDALLAQLSSMAPDEGLSVSDTVVASLVSTIVTELPLAQIEALLSGEFPALTGTPLRDELMALRAMMQDYRDDEIEARDYVMEEVAPYLRANFDIERAQRAWFDWIVLNESPSGHTELRSARHLRNLLAWRQRDYRLLASQADAVTEAMQRSADLIRAHLGQ